MARHGLRGGLLATSSLVALVIGLQGSAEAAACHYNNVAGGVDNTTAQDCIAYNGGGAFAGNVTNEATGSLTTTAVEGGPLPGTASGISVLAPGTTLTGNIVNKGTITSNYVNINIGSGNFGTPPTSPGAGATLNGSITNSGSLLVGVGSSGTTGISLSGTGSVVTGSITNDINGTISGEVGIGVTNNAHLGGSIINDGKLNLTLGHGFEINTGATIAGNVTNSSTGTITTTGSAGMSIAGSSSITGTVTNAGTITSTRYGILLAPTSIGGSVINSGIMNSGGYGIAMFGSSNVVSSNVTGNISNTGTINATGRDGIGIFAFSNIGGAVLNSNQITAARNGILVVNTTNTFGVAHVAGGISNSGTLTSNGTGFAGIALVGGTVTNGIANTSAGAINSANGVGILVSNQTPIRLSGFASTVTGGITNQGSITAKTGIVVGGGSTVAGGITNSGNITGTGGTAIDLWTVNGGEGTLTTINQQAGTITGNILLSPLANTVNISGGAIAGNIVGQGSGNTVNFALGAGTFTYSNTISGVGAVNVNSGTVSLTGTNTYTGATTVNGGILNVNGSIATSTLTTVNTGGSLTGTGTVGNTTIASGGGFAPGNGTPGTFMTVSGSLAFASGALYVVTVNPSTASFASVTGTATLNGATVNAIYANGSYVAKKYTILTATSGVSGTFGSLVNSNLPSNFKTSLSYDANDAFLNLSLNFVPPPNGGLNQNQQNVANAIVGFFNSTGSIPLVFGGLTPAGLTQASGETATGSQQATFNAMGLFMGLLTDPFFGGSGGGGTGGPGATPFAAERGVTRQHLVRAATPMPRSGTRRRRPLRLFQAGACGPQVMAARKPPTATRRWDRTTRPAASPVRPWAPTITSRRTRWPVLPSPAAAPISASTDLAADVPTCSRPAPMCVTPPDRPTSRPRSPTAGRTSRPTAPSPSPASTSCRRASTPMRIPAGPKAAIASRRHGWASRPTPPRSSRPSTCRPMPSGRSLGPTPLHWLMVPGTSPTRAASSASAPTSPGR